MTIIHDRVKLSGVSRDAWGRLVAKAAISRDGIYEYWGPEVGVDEDRIVRIYRPADEVFSRKAMAGFARAPVTLDHPPVTMRDNLNNHAQYAVGHVDPVDLGRQVIEEDGHFTANLVIDNLEAIEAIESGTRELSAGYDSEIDWTAGVDAKGQRYDGVMRTIIADHVAIVSRGRAGSGAKIGDKSRNASPAVVKTDGNPKQEVFKMTTLTVDGLTVTFSDDQSAQIIQRALQAHTDKMAEIKTALDAAEIALTKAKDEEAKLKAENAALDAKAKAAEVSDEDIESRASALNADRAAAKVLHPTLDTVGKAAAVIRKEVVDRSLGETAKDFTDAQIETAFRTLVSTAPKGVGETANTDKSSNKTADAYWAMRQGKAAA